MGAKSGDKKTTIVVTRGGYLDSVAHGSLSGYVRCVVDEHLAALRAAVALLAAHTVEEIVELVAAADLPAHQSRDTELWRLPQAHCSAVCMLASECEATGLEISELLELLAGGACA